MENCHTFRCPRKGLRNSPFCHECVKMQARARHAVVNINRSTRKREEKQNRLMLETQMKLREMLLKHERQHLDALDRVVIHKRAWGKTYYQQMYGRVLRQDTDEGKDAPPQWIPWSRK